MTNELMGAISKTSCSDIFKYQKFYINYYYWFNFLIKYIIFFIIYIKNIFSFIFQIFFFIYISYILIFFMKDLLINIEKNYKQSLPVIYTKV